MKLHTLVLTVTVIVSLVDDVCAKKSGGFSFRSSSRGSTHSRGGTLGPSRSSYNYRRPPRGNSNGWGVTLGGYYADNNRMRLMFASVVRHDISGRFRVVDLDKIKASKEAKEYAKNGELVSVSNSGYTRVTTSYYGSYGTSSSDYYDSEDYYDDDDDIYFDIYDVDTIHNRTTHKNVTLKHIQVRQCLHSLRVSKANRQSMLYACYRWHNSPFVILWIPCVIIFTMWLVVPVLLSILYVKNMRGQIKSCFLYADSGQIHQYGKIEDETLENNERYRKLKLTALIGFLAALLLSAMITCFCLTSNDLYQEDSQDAILKMQLFRAGITFLSLILFALLSLITASLKVKLYKFPLCVALSKTCACNRDEEDEVDCCGIISLVILAFMVICLALDLCLLVAFIPLKIVHLLLFSPCGFLTHSLQLVLAKINLKEINLKHFLYYAYLSDTEKVGWMKKVNSYVSVVTNQIQQEHIFHHLYLYASGQRRLAQIMENVYDNAVLEEYHDYRADVADVYKAMGKAEKVSHLHTGSIPSKFGKPLMTLGEISPSFVRSHLDIASDHDVMLVLENMPVLEVGDTVKMNTNEAGIWLGASIVENNEEFVYLSVSSGLDVRFWIENSFSSDFLKEIISKELLLKNIPLEIMSTNLGEFLRDKMDGESLVIIGKAGPSLNMKITGPDGIIIFDCDFLLSFPLVKWPSPAQEWVTRSRAWPDPVTVRRLASLPCHLIGKPMVTDTATDPYTWRFSFSNQELELASIVPHNARLCYISLKLIFKKIIKNKVPSILKSYHLLTLFFWFMELDRKVFSWDNDSVEAFVRNLEALMMFVSDRLRKGDIPHYFISTVNLATTMAVSSPFDDKKIKYHSLSYVADYIDDLVNSKEFPGKFICDQAVVHLMAFNLEEHQKIVRSRERQNDWVESNGKDNMAFSSNLETIF